VVPVSLIPPSLKGREKQIEKFALKPKQTIKNKKIYGNY
jgi:hypothetical protein